MAAGKPIVSTTVAAEGIKCDSGKNIMLADSAVEFTNSISGLLKDKQKAVQMGVKARKLIEHEYNNDSIIEKLETFYKKIIEEERL